MDPQRREAKRCLHPTSSLLDRRRRLREELFDGRFELGDQLLVVAAGSGAGEAGVAKRRTRRRSRSGSPVNS